MKEETLKNQSSIAAKQKIIAAKKLILARIEPPEVARRTGVSALTCYYLKKFWTGEDDSTPEERLASLNIPEDKLDGLVGVIFKKSDVIKKSDIIKPENIKLVTEKLILTKKLNIAKPVASKNQNEVGNIAMERFFRYPPEKREQAQKLLIEGKTVAEVVKITGIPYNNVSGYKIYLEKEKGIKLKDADTANGLVNVRSMTAEEKQKYGEAKLVERRDIELKEAGTEEVELEDFNIAEAETGEANLTGNEDPGLNEPGELEPTGTETRIPETKIPKTKVSDAKVPETKVSEVKNPQGLKLVKLSNESSIGIQGLPGQCCGAPVGIPGAPGVSNAQGLNEILKDVMHDAALSVTHKSSENKSGIKPENENIQGNKIQGKKAITCKVLVQSGPMKLEDVIPEMEASVIAFKALKVNNINITIEGTIN